MFGPRNRTLPAEWTPLGTSLENLEEERNSLSNVSPNSDLRRSVNGGGFIAPAELHSSHSSGGSDALMGRLGLNIPAEPPAGSQGPGDPPNNLDTVAPPPDQHQRLARSFRHPLPKPRMFDGTDANRSMTQFFTIYERYAGSMWGQNTSDWGAGLETLLQGWALQLYRQLSDQGKSYSVIKNTLMTAFPGVVDPFRTRSLLKLVNLKHETGEPLSVFHS